MNREDITYKSAKEMEEHMDELNKRYSKRNKEWEKYVAWADAKDALEERMDVIGQNGNDGLHYNAEVMKTLGEEFPNDVCPQHYDKPIQPWEYMESIMSEEAFQGYLEGNIIKYISRWRDKGGANDLRKAQHYLNKLFSII
jgi:hypothetical protein